jgi:ureidoglycolate hydrolase
MSQPKRITAHSFRPYGKVIEYRNKETRGITRNLWRIIHAEPRKTGWRVAYLVLRDKSLGRLECHPDSDETFEPLRGRALLFVARAESPSAVECFLLDQSVVLHKGVWHGLISLTAETEMKITENVEVTCRYRPFGFRIRSFHELQKRLSGGGP